MADSKSMMETPLVPIQTLDEDVKRAILHTVMGETNAVLTKRNTDGTVKIRVLRGHDDTVKSCQICAEDTRILTASFDRTVMLWDMETGANLHVYEGGHTLNISKARANQNCTRFVSAGWDKKINMWDTQTGDILWTGYHDSIVTCCCFSPDGSMVMSGSDLDHSVKIWDAGTGTLIMEIKNLHTSTITSVLFSPSSDRIFTTSMDKTTCVYDLQSQCNTISLKSHINIISDLSLTADERKLATVSYDKCIKIWDLTTGRYRKDGPVTIEKAHEGCVSSCDFSRDGQLLVTGGFDMQVCLWDVENEVQKLRLQGHTGWVEDVCFSQDQKWVLSSSRDKTVRLWNVEKTDEIPMVLEKRKAIGLRVLSCADCGKAFSVSEMDAKENVKQCVFCRLQKPDRNIPSISS